MRRREFITLVGGATAAWPIAARAQQTAMPVVGYLEPGTPEGSTDTVAAFRKGLSEAGFDEGRNVTLEYRWGHNDPSRMPELTADLVRRRVAIIAALGSTAAALEAKAATTTVPIVFTGGADPVQIGLVASLHRPGGNVTGLTSMNAELMPKRLGLLQELLPKAARFAALADFANNPTTESSVTALRAAGSAMGRQIEVFYASSNREIDTAFARLVQERVDALLILPLAFFGNRRVQLVTLAVHHRVPAIYFQRAFVEAGGLMSYGTSLWDRDRQAGIYVGRILKGEKPADLPVLQPTKFEFVINRQTARLLNIDFPSTLLALADEVIE